MPSRASSIPSTAESPAPLVRSLVTHDFDQMARSFVQWDHRFEQLSPGRFQGRLQFAHLDGVQLFDVQANQVIHSRGGRPADTFTFSPVLPENAGAHWRGRILRPGMINVLGPRQETDHRTSRDYRNTSLIVRRDILERSAHGLIGVGLDELLGAQAPQMAPGVGDALALRWREALRSIARHGVQTEIDTMPLVAELVRSLAEGRIVDPVRLTPAQRLLAVRKAEDFARAHPTESVPILELCEVTGVSERSLHYAFLEVTGLTPMAYLKAIRLNQARREILESEHERGQIHAIARRNGFHRPGNFAADFHRFFGVLPSRALGTRRP